MEAKCQALSAAKCKTEWHRKELEASRKATESGRAEALNELAWLLATCEDATMRDGRSAVQLAEKAVAVTSRQDPNLLDTFRQQKGRHAECAPGPELGPAAVAAPRNSTGYSLTTALGASQMPRL
jgi:hypothetical protein